MVIKSCISVDYTVKLLYFLYCYLIYKYIMVTRDKYLWGLNDRIISSEVSTLPRIILPEEIQRFQSTIGSIVSFWSQLDQLPYAANATLNMLDFDDTLYSRTPQLQLPTFQDNRGSAWDRVLEEMGHQNVLEQFYRSSRAVRRLMWIIEKQWKNHKALILTAWNDDWQIGKCASIWIHGWVVPIEVVPSWADKPRTLLEYIIELWYIPGKIIIYEDRPEYFLQSASALAKMLPHTEIVIDKVTLAQWHPSRQIDSIEQTIFKVESVL